MASKLETALKIYADGVKRFILQKLKAAHGTGPGWVETYGHALSEKRRENFLEDLKRGKSPEEAVDLAHFKDVLLGNRDVFKPALGRFYNRVVTWADEIQEVRNDWAHQKEIPPEEEYRALDNIARVLRAIGATEAAGQIRALIQAPRDQEKTPEQPPPPQGTLVPWWEIAEPHPDIRFGRFDENTFAAKLDDVASGNAAPEYLFADEFFQKTYLTSELKSVLKDTLKRLAGVGGEAVVQLRTPFGGGKTHALIALYHLIKDSATSGGLPEVQAMVRESGLEDIPRARVAVLVGTALDPLGRETEEGLKIQTLWGELAYQLGGEAAYRFVAEADRARTAPGKERLIELLRGHAPSLILMDEVLLYLAKAAGVPVGTTTLQAQTLAFLQELTEAVDNVPGVALLTTFPESHIEYMEANPEKVEAVFARLEKIFARVQAVRVPVQGEEIYEVIRRRLFSNVDHGRARSVAAAYHELFRQHEDLPDEARTPGYRRLIERAFPFHPELVRLLYERWGTIQGFQKTRGVLQLLARIVEQNYRSNQARPLIGPGNVDLKNPDLRAAVIKPLQDANWESVIASDIVGKARELDEQIGGEYKRHRLAETVATAIFMFSHSGGGKDGVTKPWLDLSLIYPQGITRELVSDALDRLKGRLFYLYENGTWVFRAQPNLNAVLNDELALVPEEQILERVYELTKRVAGKGAFRPILWPKNHKDVPDDTSLKLVIYAPEHADETDESTRIRHVVQQNAPGGPRVNKNTLVHLFMSLNARPGLFGMVRQEIALENLRKRSRELALSEEQKRELEDRLTRIRNQLPERIKAAYSELYEPIDGQGRFRYHPAKTYVQTEPTLVAAVESLLKQEDRLLASLDPGLITRGYDLWPGDEPFLSLDRLRNYFFRLPELPMLEGDEVLKRAIAEAVRIGIAELAVRQGDAFAKTWVATNSPKPQEIHLSETYVLARPGTLPNRKRQDEETPDPTKPNIKKPDPDPTPPPPGPTPPPPAVRSVRIRLNRLDPSQVPAIIDLISGLRDAGGQVAVTVTLVAENPEGLDENTLALTVKELLSQHGFDYEWDES